MLDYLSTMVLGAFLGSVYALDGLGLVLTYRTSGVLNFAQGALGMFFAYFFFQLNEGGRLHFVVHDYHQTWKLPTWVALALTLFVVAPLVGFLLDVVLFRRLRAAGTVVQIVATIGLLLSLQGIAAVVWTNTGSLVTHSLFPTRVVSLGGIHARENQLLTLVVIVALCAALISALRFTPIGMRMRAVVDRPEVAEIMGVNSGRVSSTAWALATSFAALAGILVTPFYGSLDIPSLTFLVIPAMTTAVIGKLASLPLTLAGGIGVGILQLFAQKYAPHSMSSQLSSSVPFAVLFLLLFLPIRWPAAQGTSAPGKPLPVDRSSFTRRAVRVAILGAVLVIVPLTASSTLARVMGSLWRHQLAYLPAIAIIFLSLVVVTGYAGQISLVQAGLAGVGAFVAAHLVSDHHIPFLLAAVLGAAVTVPLGALLASRATALPPLFLGLATLAFGAFLDQVVFSAQSFSNGQAGVLVHRPGFLRADLAYYFGTLAAFGLCAFMVSNLRKGKTGLALVAMRDSPDGLASLGTSLARSKLVTFCISAFLAGLGGAFYAGASGKALSGDFTRYLSLIFLALAVVGGISRWPGALLGAAIYWLPASVFAQPFFVQNTVMRKIFHGSLVDLLPIFFGLGAIGLASNPHGAIEQSRENFGSFVEQARLITTPYDDDDELLDVDGDIEPLAGGDGPPRSDRRAVTFAATRLYHLDSCVLTTGKEAVALTASAAVRYDPCPICNPPLPPGRASTNGDETHPAGGTGGAGAPLRAGGGEMPPGM